MSVLSQLPPRISHSSPILASIVDLPPNPLICCSVFTASQVNNASEQLAAIENARRRIFREYESIAIAESLLVSVHLTKDNVSMYVFALGSTTEASASQTALTCLQFPDLEGA